MHYCVRIVSLAALLLAAAVPTQAAAAELVSLATPRGAKQAFILIKPKAPVASVVLFAGDHGALGLTGAASMKWGSGNFLVRMRDTFAAQGFMVAVVDAPSDQQKGMNGIFRMSKAHAGDIAVVAAYLKKQADVPVWLVGTSMGTFSAAGVAIGAKGIDGLVLTSTITRSKPHWSIAKSHPDGVASMALGQITVPTLVIASTKDTLIPPSATKPLAAGIANARYEVIEHAGHLSNLQAPTQFNSLLRQHVERVQVAEHQGHGHRPPRGMRSVPAP